MTIYRDEIEKTLLNSVKKIFGKEAVERVKRLDSALLDQQVEDIRKLILAKAEAVREETVLTCMELVHEGAKETEILEVLQALRKGGLR
jgi:hypothetical protein